MLTLRPTGLSSPAYRDWLDYVIVENGRDVGRVYEDRHSWPELRWFWSITVYVNPKLGIMTSGRAASMDGQRRNSCPTGGSAARSWRAPCAKYGSHQRCLSGDNLIACSWAIRLGLMGRSDARNQVKTRVGLAPSACGRSSIGRAAGIKVLPAKD